MRCFDLRRMASGVTESSPVLAPPASDSDASGCLGQVGWRVSTQAGVVHRTIGAVDTVVLRTEDERRVTYWLVVR